MMEYKGYVGEFEYDEASGFFYGRVVNTATSYSIASFMARERHRMREEFQISVDVYLESCAEDGVEPLPPLPIAGNVAAAADAREPQPAIGAGDGN